MINMEKNPVNKLATETEARENDVDAHVNTVAGLQVDKPAHTSGKGAPLALCRRRLAWPGAGEMKSCIGLGQFLSLSSDREAQMFCEGLSKKLFKAMRGMTGLQISKIPRIDRQRMTGAVKWKELTVNATLMGKVRKIGGRLRISVRLTSGSDGSVMWSGMYEHRFENALAIQGEIVRAIVHTVPI
jgi:TolB-like protein